MGKFTGKKSGKDFKWLTGLHPMVVLKSADL